MKKQTKQQPAKGSDIRLLPAVISIGAMLFLLKAGGLAFTANAAQSAPAKEAPAAAAPAKAAPASTTPAASPAAPADPLAAIQAALPIPPKGSAPAEAPAPADELSAELAASGVSAAEMDVLTSLSERRDTLEQRQRELDLRTNMISAAEKRVDSKIGELKALQAKIEALLGQRDQKELEQLDGLVRVYSAMKPKDAARIFTALDDTVRLGVAGRMKPDIMAGVLAALPAEVAQKMTVALANRYKADTATQAAATAAATPAPTAAAAAPAASAASAPTPANPPGG